MASESQSAPLKVVFFIGTLNVGGAQRQLLTLARGLIDMGCHVQVLVGDRTGREIPLDSYKNVPVHFVNQQRGSSLLSRIWQWIRLPVNLRRHINKSQPDVVYSMLEASNFIAWLATLGRYRRTLIWGYRCAGLMDSTKIRVFEKLCALVSKSVELLIANSNLGLEFASGMGYEPRNRMVIPNGVDTILFAPDARIGAELRSEFGIKPGEICVGIVGRLDPVKRHDLFIEAALLLSKEINNIRFIVVGGGTNAQERQLQRHIDTLGLSASFVLIPHTDKMHSIYNLLDTMVLCSDSEAFPNVVLEAMSCGVPVVATNVGDVAFMLGDTGIVVAEATPFELQQSVLTLLQRRELESIKSRSRVADTFSIDKLVLSHIEVFDSVKR